MFDVDAPRLGFSRRRRAVLDSEVEQFAARFIEGEFIMIKIRGFAHSALRITDADRAIGFYENVLGLKKLASRPNFKFGGAW